MADGGFILWMVEIELRFAPPKKPLETITFVGFCRGIESFQGFLGGAGFRPSTVSLL